MGATVRQLRFVVLLAAVTAGVLAGSVSSSGAAEKSRFFEETAQAFWSVPHECSDGSTVPATLLVASTRDYESPDTEDQDPTVRIQYQAVCADGTSYTWGGILPATIESTANLKGVHVTGSGTVRDIGGVLHEVSVDVTWTGVGSVVSTVNGPGSSRKERPATATGRVTFDGAALVDGSANHPTRPAPFIRTDIEK